MSQVNRGYVDEDEKGGSVTLVGVKKIGVEWEEKMSNRLGFAVVLSIYLAWTPYTGCVR